MNRPQVRNAISFSLINRFNEAIEDVRFDSEARVVILRSNHTSAFCAGADLKERRTLPEAELRKWSLSIRAMTTHLAQLPVPVLAAVDGFALGGGLELALACDIRVAASNAKMGFPETGLAIIPGAGGTQRTPRLIGPSAALDLILTGRIVDGQEAETLGLVNYAVAQNEAGDAAYRKAETIAERILEKGPIGIRMAKQAIAAGMQVDIATGLTLEQQCYQQTIPTEDRLEALEAFKDKRSPIFKGK